MGGSEKYRVLSGGKSNTSTTTTSSSSKKSSGEYRENKGATVPAGCMSGVFQFFDFHQFQLSSLNHHVCFKPPNDSSFIHQEELIEPNLPIKGVEAPRNSLESEENLIMGGADNETVVVLSSEIKEEDFGFPVGIRVQTKRGGVSDFSSSESSNSPCTKTPNLVARLMGLDILPENTLSSPYSPSSSLPSSINSKSSKTHSGDYLQDSINGGFGSLHHRQVLRSRLNDINTGSRSLPDTPRISSARRSDVDPSRLSLQINKENILMNEEFDYFGGRSSVDSITSLSSLSSLKKSRKREWKTDETENRSPSHYARQIVKQVKESVSRKMGRDITNFTTTTTNGRTKSSEGEAKTVTKTKKTSRLNRSNSADDSTPSCSPRLRFLETKNNINKQDSTIPDQNSYSSKKSSLLSIPASPPPQPAALPPSPPPPQLKASAKPKTQTLPQHQTIEKCKKASCERFTQRKEVVSVRKSTASSKQVNLNFPDHQKKFKKSSPSSSSPSSPLSKDISVISSPTPTSMNSGQLSSASNSSTGTSSSSLYEHRYDKFTGRVAEFRYVSHILKCTGIETNTYISFTKWYSPSHPLDPSIFHHLEESFFPTGSLRHQTNRRLIFNFVDEILVQILRPYLNMNPWLMNSRNNTNKLLRGDQLLQKLWLEIQNSPSANCQFLQDIDALIEKDLPPPHDANMRTLPIFKEGESIVLEIERDIVDSLVHELALTAFS